MFTRNNWHKVSDDYWLCLYWDVWFEYGAWRASFYPVGCSRLNERFRTAQAAMAFVDRKVNG